MSAEVEFWTPALALALWEAHQHVHPEVSTERFAQDVLGLSVGALYRWRRDPTKPLRPSTQQILKRYIREQASPQLVSRFHATLRQNEQATLLPEPTVMSTRSGATVGEELALVADDAAYEALLFTGSVGDTTQRLHDLVVAAADSYTDKSPKSEFDDLRRLRDLAKHAATQTRRPNEQSDLLVILGQASALMASVGFDLGYWDSAIKLASAATTYAEMAGHSSLTSWALGLQGTIAFWNGNPGRALDYVGRALESAPAGASRFRLRNIEARAHAVAGNPIQVGESLTLALRDRDDAEGVRDSLHDGVGGEFQFDDARAAACAAAAWLAVRNGERAEEQAQLALSAAFDVPDHRRQGPINGSKIDVATARLLVGDVAGAEQYLQDILAIEPTRRTVSLAGRLQGTQRVLAAKPGLDGGLAGDLSDRVSSWLATAYKVGDTPT